MPSLASHLFRRLGSLANKATGLWRDMHPKKRRCTESPAAPAGQSGPGAPQTTGLPRTTAEVIDLTGDEPPPGTGASGHGFYNPENHSVTFPAPGSTSGVQSSAQFAWDLQAQEEASLHLAQQLQALEHETFMQHITPSTSQSPHGAAAIASQSLAQPMQAGLEGPSIPADAFAESDEAIAMELQAQFEAELSQDAEFGQDAEFNQDTTATAGPSGWAPEQASASAATEEETPSSQATSSDHGDDIQSPHCDDDKPREAAQHTNLPNGAISPHGFARRIVGARCSRCQSRYFKAEVDVVKTFKRAMNEDSKSNSSSSRRSSSRRSSSRTAVRPMESP